LLAREFLDGVASQKPVPVSFRQPAKMTAATGKFAQRTHNRSVLPWAMLVLGIPASLVLFVLIQVAVEDVAKLRFERYASDAKHVIEARVRSYAEVLRGLQALFATQDRVTRAQFNRFVESLELKNRYPGFDVVNYAAYVPFKEKERFEESVRGDISLDPRGYPQFGIKPPGNRSEYFVMVYVVPMSDFEYAFGLDLGANPGSADPQALAATMRASRDSGKLTASGLPIRVKAAKEYIGLAMRVPVYRSGMSIGTVEQRRAAYLGSVGAGFNVEKLMRGVLADKSAHYLRFRLYDVGPADAVATTASTEKEWLLFDSSFPLRGAPTQSATEDLDAVFMHALPMEVGGRRWQVHFSAQKNAIIERTDALLPWLVLGGGLLSSVLLSGMFYSLASSRSRAVEIANEITRDLRSSTEQLQAVSRRLVDLQESERRQFSRELHDRVGQNLTALSISLDILKTQVSGNGSDTLRARLDDASSLLESTAGAIENVMSELRPPMLDDYGLLPALQWYANEFSGRTGVEVRVDGDERMERLTQASEIGLFRIAQEALNNVAKHAQAQSVDITLEYSDNEFTMSIIDDGGGLDPESIPATKRRPGLGMMTMRERTQAVGGQFEVASAPGGGTRVMVRIPC